MLILQMQLSATGVGAGTYGSNTQVPLIKLMQKEEFTTVTTTGINF